MERSDSQIIIRNLKNKSIQRMNLNLDKIFKKIIIEQKPLLFSSFSTKNLGTNKKFKLTAINNTPKNKIIQKDIDTLLDNDLLTNKELRSHLIKIKSDAGTNTRNKLNCKKQFKKRISIQSINNKIHKINIVNILKDKFLLSDTKKVVQNLRNIFSRNILPEQNKFKFGKIKSYIDQDLCYSDRKDNSNSERQFISRSIIVPKCSKNHNFINLFKISKLKDEKLLRNYEENQIYKIIVKKGLIRSHSSFTKFNKSPNYFSYNK